MEEGPKSTPVKGCPKVMGAGMIVAVLGAFRRFHTGVKGCPSSSFLVLSVYVEGSIWLCTLPIPAPVLFALPLPKALLKGDKKGISTNCGKSPG
jgi:hypothetical protein